MHLVTLLAARLAKVLGWTVEMAQAEILAAVRSFWPRFSPEEVLNWFEKLCGDSERRMGTAHAVEGYGWFTRSLGKIASNGGLPPPRMPASDDKRWQRAREVIRDYADLGLDLLPGGSWKLRQGFSEARPVPDELRHRYRTNRDDIEALLAAGGGSRP
jgi:hypothetical protein